MGHYQDVTISPSVSAFPMGDSRKAESGSKGDGAGIPAIISALGLVGDAISQPRAKVSSWVGEGSVFD